MGNREFGRDRDVVRGRSGAGSQPNNAVRIEVIEGVAGGGLLSSVEDSSSTTEEDT